MGWEMLGNDGAGRSDRVWLLATGWFMWLFIGAWAISPASVLLEVMADLAIRETAAAWIITAPQVAATVAGIPIGMYLDRIDQRHAVFGAAGLLLLVGVGGSLVAAEAAYWALIGTRFIGGIALVTIWTAQTTMVTRAFPAKVEATAVSVFVTGYPVGYAIGQFTAPIIAEVLDWTATFGIYGAVGFGFAVVFWIIGRGVPDASGSGNSPSLGELGRALGSKGVWGVALLSLFSYMLYMIFNGWMPTYIAQTFDLGLRKSGLYTALFPAIGILARPSGGLLAERVFGGRGRPVIAISFVVAGLMAIAMALGHSLIALMVGLVAAGFAIQMQFGLLYALVQRFVPLNVGSTAVAVVSAVGWLGSVLGPPAVGAGIEALGSYEILFGLSVVIAFLGLLTVWRIAEPERA